MIFQTIVMLLLFLLISLMILYPLGYLLIGNNTKKLYDIEAITLSFASSIVFLVLLSILLSTLNLREIFIFIIVILNLYSVFKYRKALLTPWAAFFRNRVLLGLIILGILVQGFINFPNGYLYKEGLLFWSSQGLDGFWHLTLMNAVAKGVPPEMPLYAGELLKNYHYLADILMGEYLRVFSLFTPLDLYFRFFPVLFSFLMGISVYSFVRKWKDSQTGYWSVFFTYFVGSFGYIYTFIKSGRIFGGETVFWVSQLNTIIANPPHAMAIILLCSFLLAFMYFNQYKNRGWILTCLLIGSILSGFKISGGALLLAGMGVVSFIQIIRERKLDYLYLFLLLVASNFATAMLVSKDAGSYLIFEPWWFIRTMVVTRLDLIDWELRRQTYLYIGRFTSYLRVLQLEGTAFLIFVVGNLGTRILGLVVMGRNLLGFKKKIIDSPIDAFLLTVAFVGFVIPMLFLQKGVVFNIIQFMQYVLLVTGIYAAIFVSSTLKKIRPLIFKLVFVFLLVCLSIPTVIGNFVEFYGGPPNAVVTNSELSALNYIKENSTASDVILAPPFHINDKYGYDRRPLPIFAWFDTSYVSALTGRSMFFESEVMLDQTGFDVKTRPELARRFFDQKDFEFNKSFLKEYNISYVYVPNKNKYTLSEDKNSLKKVFTNGDVEILKVE